MILSVSIFNFDVRDLQSEPQKYLAREAERTTVLVQDQKPDLLFQGVSMLEIPSMMIFPFTSSSSLFLRSSSERVSSAIRSTSGSFFRKAGTVLKNFASLHELLPPPPPPLLLLEFLLPTLKLPLPVAILLESESS